MKTIGILFLLLAMLLPASAQSLRLASYNIRHGRNMEKKMNLERTAALLKTFKADIIALQEVDNKCKRSGGVDQAKFLGVQLGMHHAFGKFMNYQGGEYGMAILSRFPILEIHRHSLPKGAEPRIALEIEVEVEKGKRASFISIHFDYTSEVRRQPQIKVLLEALKDTNHPVALIGDFNAQPGSKSMALFKEEEWYNVPKKGLRFTFPADDPKIEIDYILLRGFQKPAHTIVIDEKLISDHRPLISDVKLN